MYMLVFVTLMVVLFGTYAQIFTKQALMAYRQQENIVGAMVSWHGTAVGLAANLLSPATFTTTGCSLTNLSGVTGAPSLSYCQRNSTNIMVSSTNGSGVNACNGTNFPPCWTPLPTGYSFSRFPFYTVAYMVTGTPTYYYVLTFVPPPVTTGQNWQGLDLLCLPGVVSTSGITKCPASQQQLPGTFSELQRQIKKTSLLQPMFYGTVRSNTLVTQTIGASSGSPTIISYPVPTFVPAGSIGIISAVSTCTSC